MIWRLLLGVTLSLAGWIIIGYALGGLPGRVYLIASCGAILIQVGTNFICWASERRAREKRYVYNLDSP